MKDYLEFESCPIDENCAQLLSNDGNPNFHKDNLLECAAMANQLRRKFPNIPKGVTFKINNNQHDAGEYRDIHIIFDDEVDEQCSYVYEVDANYPFEWDDEAITELTIGGYSLFNGIHQ